MNAGPPVLTTLTIGLNKFSILSSFTDINAHLKNICCTTESFLRVAITHSGSHIVASFWHKDFLSWESGASFLPSLLTNRAIGSIQEFLSTIALPCTQESLWINNSGPFNVSLVVILHSTTYSVWYTDDGFLRITSPVDFRSTVVLSKLHKNPPIAFLRFKSIKNCWLSLISKF